MIQKIKQLYKTNELIVLPVLLTLFTLPGGFYYFVGGHLDSSWIRAINLAIENNLIFGKDIVFTYGPLGYLSTRNTQYISNFSIFAGDLLLLVCFYYTIRKLLVKDKRWFWILLAAIFYFKNTEYACSAFLFFTVFAVANIKNSFSNTIEMLLCTITAVLVFFVKINYGLVSLPVFFALLVYASATGHLKQALGMLLAACVLFFSIYLSVHLDLYNYIRNNILLIKGYNEAMQLTIDPTSTSFNSVLVFLGIYLTLAGAYLVRATRERKLNVGDLLMIALTLLMFYLSYKNGFTRNDGHNDGFFALMPLYLVFICYYFDLFSRISGKILCVLTILVSDTNLTLHRACDGKGFIVNNVIGDSTSYFQTFFRKQNNILDFETLKLPQKTLDIIGSSAVDILPIDVSIIHVNRLHYNPRPVIQSYSAYSGPLDSLNLHHFAIQQKPKFLIMGIFSIDNRMVAWDESLTKATIVLNYEYAGFTSTHNDTALENGPGSYMLLRAKNTDTYPVFEKLYDTTIDFDDTLQIDFPEDEAVYMTANIAYSFMGRIKSVIYNPTEMSADLFLNKECTSAIGHKMCRPIVEGPVLINKTICMNVDFADYISGNIKKMRNVKAIAFHAKSTGDVKPSVKLTFYRFANYPARL